MMDEQELNKKLAEWAGFGVMNEYRFLTPDNEVVKINYFTQSLDACIKWLVPKLKGYSLSKPTFLGMCVAIVYIDDSSFEGVDLEPAQALCLAIEKLIDGGK